jgi:hypothetical protein
MAWEKATGALLIPWKLRYKKSGGSRLSTWGFCHTRPAGFHLPGEEFYHYRSNFLVDFILRRVVGIFSALLFEGRRPEAS